MKVTCHYTKEKIDKKNAFAIKLEKHKNNTYFKSEKIYNTWVEEERLKEEIPYILNNILGRSKYHKIHYIFNKKLSVWLKSYSYTEIHFTLNHFKEDVIKYRYKGVPYIAQVIENKLIEGKELFDSKKKSNDSKIKVDLDIELENKINNHKFVSIKKDMRRYIVGK